MSGTPTMAKRFFRPTRKKTDPPPPIAMQPPTPDALPKPEPRNMIWMVLPVLLVVGLAGMIAVFVTIKGLSGPMYAFPGLAGLSVVGMAMYGGTRLGRKMKQTWGEREQGRRDYLDELDKVRDENQNSASEQYDANHEANTPPALLPNLVGDSDRMWRRRPSDPDFLDVRLGSGIVEADQGSLNWADMNIPVDEELESVSGNSLRRFMNVQTKIPGMGKVVNLRSQPGFAIVGESELVTGLVWSMLCELAAYQSPAEVKIAVVTYRPWDWDWVKWLPHNRHSTLVDACGPRRLVFEKPLDLEETCAADLNFKDRGTWERPVSASDTDEPSSEPSQLAHGDDESQSSPSAHWIVVDDNTGTNDEWKGLMGDYGMASVTFLRIAESSGTGIGFSPRQIFEVRR